MNACEYLNVLPLNKLHIYKQSDIYQLSNIYKQFLIMDTQLHL